MLTFVRTVFLIRHASPDLNRSDLVYHLPPGPPLTSTGLQEAAVMAEFLKEAGNIGRIYTSPLDRCLQTARVIAQKICLPVQVEPGLAEVDPAETEADLRARVWPVWQKALDGESTAAGKNEAVALVTHGAPVALLLKDLKLDEESLNTARQRFDHSNPLPPAGVWRAARQDSQDDWQLDLVFVPEDYNIKS